MIKIFFVFLALLTASVASANTYTLQLHDVRLPDFVRVVYGDILNRSYTLDQNFLTSTDSVSITWRAANKKQIEARALDLLSRHGFYADENNGLIFFAKTEKLDDVPLIYSPRYRSARYLADVVSKVAGIEPLGTRGMQATPDMAQAINATDQVQGSVSTKVDNLSNDQLAFACSPRQCDKLKHLLISLDTREAEVLLRAVVYEVGTSKGDGSAYQVAAKLLQNKLQINIGSIVAGGASLRVLAGGLDAVFSVLDQDSRFKVVSRPMLRVRTGGQGKFSVGQQVPVLGALSQDKNGNSIQSVEYRQSGTIFTVSPDVRADVVDLNVSQEISNFVATTTGVNNSPTLLQRTASSQLTVKDGEVVVFAGLQESRDDATASRLFGFNVGTSASRTGSEVLLFLEAQKI